MPFMLTFSLHRFVFILKLLASYVSPCLLFSRTELLRLATSYSHVEHSVAH